MSRGRRTVKLSDLQSLVGSDRITSVTEHLLGVGTTPAVHRPTVHRGPTPEPPRADRHLDPNADWAWRGRQVDWPYRTTPEDVLEEAAELAVERLPWRLAVLVDHVVFGTGGKSVQVSGRERSLIEAEVRKCRVQVMRSLAKSPGRKPQVKRPRVRTEGPCSAVVTKTRDGRFLVNGHEVEYLIPEDYAVPGE